MKQFKITACSIVAALLCLAAFSPTFADTAAPQIAQGDYSPAGGAVAHWSIDSSHTLTWAGQAYIPAGGLFQPRCMATPGSDTQANWSADQANLSTLKAHGVTQLLLAAGSSSGTTPITAVAPGTLQRVIDYLNQNGFTYGLDLNAYPPGSFDAVVVNPAIYRAPQPEANSTVPFRSVEGIVTAKYFVASTHDGTVLSEGDAQVSGNSSASVDTGSFGGNDSVLLLYPTRKFGDTTIEGRHCPNFWAKADDVRDSLLMYLNRIKFGAGLRFFVDPMRDDLGYYGAASEGMIPTSPEYQEQFATWLVVKYGDRLPLLERAWGVKNEDLPDFETAARSIPLWYQLKGIQSLYDPKSNTLFDINTGQSVVWSDIRAFQDDSMQNAMNGIAVALRNGAADVPVVYRWTQAGAATINFSANGFDGLIVDSPLHGNDLADQAVGFALSDVEHARRTQWLMAELTPPDPIGRTSGPHAQVGLGSQIALTGDTQLLADLSVHGFYIDTLHGNSPSDIDLLSAPAQQLDWLHTAAAEQSADAASLSAERPSILYYPASLALPGAQIQQLSCGAWWLPANLDSEALDLGSGVEGYTIQQSSGPEYVLYSTSDKDRTLSFPMPHGKKSDKPVCENAMGTRLKIDMKKGDLVVTVSQDPVILSGIRALPLPKNAMGDELAEVQRLIALGKKAKAPVAVFEQRLYYIQNNPLLSSPAANQTDYGLLRLLAAQLKLFVSPYIWLEAEGPISQSFGGAIASPDASGGAYLWLDRGYAPPKGGSYSAKYAFVANTPGDYDIWMSVAPAPGESSQSSASPFTVAIDDGTVLTPDILSPSGTAYGSLSRSGSTVVGQFVWYRLTTVHMNAGEHTLTIRVTGPAKATGRWTLGIDAICLSRGDFEPNGAVKPSF